jgi:hypothetical protein
LTRRRLLGDGHGILEVKNHRICCKGERPFDAAGMVRRREKE